MAKAKITLANGTQIVIEGAPAEVAAIVDQIGEGSPSPRSARTKVKATTSQRRPPKDKKIKTSPTDLILSLADGGFFKTPKDLAAIKEGLAEIGHIYAVQTLSSIVFKMVRRRYLRRVKQDGRWVYIR